MTWLASLTLLEWKNVTVCGLAVRCWNPSLTHSRASPMIISPLREIEGETFFKNGKKKKCGLQLAGGRWHMVTSHHHPEPAEVNVWKG